MSDVLNLNEDRINELYTQIRSVLHENLAHLPILVKYIQEYSSSNHKSLILNRINHIKKELEEVIATDVSNPRSRMVEIYDYLRHYSRIFI